MNIGFEDGKFSGNGEQIYLGAETAGERLLIDRLVKLLEAHGIRHFVGREFVNIWLRKGAIGGNAIAPTREDPGYMG